MFKKYQYLPIVELNLTRWL